MLKLTIAQLNVTVGDIEGNVEKMVSAARQAWDHGSDLVVFSELSLSGYYPGDLLEEPRFMQRVEQGLDALLQASRQLRNLHWVVGAPVARGGPGKRLHNMLLVIKAGEIAAALRQAAAAHLQRLRRTASLRAGSRRGQGPSHRRGASRVPDLRG